MAQFLRSGRLAAWKELIQLWFSGLWLLILSSTSLIAANSNPSVTFLGANTNGTNFYTHPAGKNFQFKLFSISNYASFSNRLLTDVTTSTNRIRRYSNDTVTFSAAPFARVGTNLTLTNFPIHGISFEPETGYLIGTPRTNFILTIDAGALRLVSTNQVSERTNLLTPSNGFETNFFVNRAPTSFTNTNNQIGYRFTFFSNAPVAFSITHLATNTTTNLPRTNPVTGQTNVYRVVLGPGVILDGSSGVVPNNSWPVATDGPFQLQVSNSGTVTLLVGSVPTADGLWAWGSDSFSVTVTNRQPIGFLFVTNTNFPAFTRTNLTYLDSTPLILANPGASNTLSFALSPAGAGRLFTSNGLSHVQALSGSGTFSVVASRPATSTSAAVTATQQIALFKRPSAIEWRAPFRSNSTTFTNTNPLVVSCFLSAVADSGARVVFSTPNTSASITNERTLLFSNDTNIEVVATAIGENPALWHPAAPKTNRVFVQLASMAAPGFTSTNRRDGVQGLAYAHRLAASNATSYLATNLPPGLSFDGTNLISGTHTQPGFYRITCVAQGSGGAHTNSLFCLVSPSNLPSQTNPWTFAVSLGLHTNTNGTYILSNPPAGVALLTNTGGALPGSLLLTNTNLSNGFAGTSNITVTFSNPTIGSLTTNFHLQIAPALPTLVYPSSLTLTQGTAMTNLPATLTGTNIPGYPLVIRSLRLPLGLQIDSSNGVIRGIPTAAGVYLSSVWAENATGSSETNPIQFDIRPQAVSSQPLQLSLAGLFSNRPGTYSISNLPAGLTLSPSSGFISGRPLSNGNVTLAVVFTPLGGGAPVTNTTYTLNIAGADLAPGVSPPTLTYADTVLATQGVSLSLAPSVLTGTNDEANPVTFLAQALPPGLSVNPANGFIQGTPTSGGALLASVWAKNAAGSSAPERILFQITPRAVAGRPLLVQLSGLFSNQPGRYGIANLTPGLVLSDNSGSVSGQPLAIGTFTWNVQFTPLSGPVSSNNFSLTVLPPAPSLILPTRFVTAVLTQNFLLQPWVTGSGWSWSGHDPFSGLGLSRGWGLSGASNDWGSLRLATNGSALTLFSTGTNFQSLQLLRNSPLPGTTPWQAFVRARVAPPVTNGFLQPFLGAYRAPSEVENQVDAMLVAEGAAQLPSALHPDGTTSLTALPAGHEVLLHLAYDPEQGGRLTASANTNVSLTNFTRTNLAVSTNLLSRWGVTNRLEGFRLWLGVDSSNAPSTNNAVLLRNFVVQPSGIIFSAIGLPPGISIDSNLGTLAGVPTTLGTYTALISAANAQGTNTQSLSIRVVSP